VTLAPSGRDATGAAGRARRAAWLALKVLVAGAALWLAFRQVSFETLGSALSDASAAWVAVALVSVAATLAAGVARWRLLFYPDHRAWSWRTLAYALLIGQTVNILLPLRFGELARAGLLSATDRAPIARVLATLAVERLADLVILGLATTLLLLSVSLPQWLHAPGQALVALAAAALAVVIALTLDARRAADWMQRGARRLPERFHMRAARHIDEAAAGLSSLRSVSASAQLWGLSAAILLMAASTNYLLFVAFGFALPAASAICLLVVLQVGNTAVSVPGNLGVFHYLTVLTLAVYGIDRERALAYAIVLYAVALLPKIALGVLIMAVGPHGFSYQAVRQELGR